MEKIKDFFLGWMQSSPFGFGIIMMFAVSGLVYLLIETFSQTVANTIIITAFCFLIFCCIRYLWKNRFTNKEK